MSDDDDVKTMYKDTPQIDAGDAEDQGEAPRRSPRTPSTPTIRRAAARPVHPSPTADSQQDDSEDQD